MSSNDGIDCLPHGCIKSAQRHYFNSQTSLATWCREWIAKSWFSPEPLVVISFGVITAAAYHLLATRKRERGSEAD